MKKQEFQLSTASIKFVFEFLTNLVSTGKSFKIEISEWRESGTNSQRKTYFMWMGEIADGFNKMGLTQQIYSNGKLVMEKPWDKDFAHEFIMKYFYPSNEDGSRMSLREILKDRGAMCHLLDKLTPWAAEKGIFLTIPNKHWYWEHKNEQG